METLHREEYFEHYYSSGVLLLIEARLSQFQALSPTSSEAEAVSLVGVHIHINIVSVYIQNKYVGTEAAT